MYLSSDTKEDCIKLANTLDNFLHYNVDQAGHDSFDPLDFRKTTKLALAYRNYLSPNWPIAFPRIGQGVDIVIEKNWEIETAFKDITLLKQIYALSQEY